MHSGGHAFAVLAHYKQAGIKRRLPLPGIPRPITRSVRLGEHLARPLARLKLGLVLVKAPDEFLQLDVLARLARRSLVAGRGGQLGRSRSPRLEKRLDERSSLGDGFRRQVSDGGVGDVGRFGCGRSGQRGSELGRSG